VLPLRRGRVLAAAPPEGGWQVLEVDVAGARRPAHADTGLLGETRTGDEVLVNVAALDLGLGSGGFDVLHANLSRGLRGEGEPGAHVMKLNYTSLQHAVTPVEAERGAPPEGSAGSVLGVPVGKPVAVLALHGQLAPVAWAFARGNRTGRPLRLGYVQTAGGALPGRLGRDARALRARGLLAGWISAGSAYGGEEEAMSTPGALHAGLARHGWDAAVCGPGPGIVGSDSALGHGGMEALASAHAALALGSRTLVVPRMSSADPRARHRGLSHHTRTVLDLLLKPVTVALPPGREPGRDPHDWRPGAADLDGYRATGLPARTMGRTLDEDPDFFAAALAGGSVLAALADEG